MHAWYTFLMSAPLFTNAMHDFSILVLVESEAFLRVFSTASPHMVHILWPMTSEEKHRKLSNVSLRLLSNKHTQCGRRCKLEDVQSVNICLIHCLSANLMHTVVEDSRLTTHEAYVTPPLSLRISNAHYGRRRTFEDV